MESLKEEVIRVHGCKEEVVMENESYCVSLLQFTNPRAFMICSTETKRNCSTQDIKEIFTCMTEFIKNNSELSPCYSFIDVTKTDVFTIQLLSTAADTFKNCKSFLETRLIGTVMKVDDEIFNNGFLSKALQRLYTPVRPVKWYRKPGDGSGFITEWEEKLGGIM
uniref:Uncharacterized protein n=1 Tax=viral metagenome TaxID=1070528 RepID=A0A6C0J082_9ZZZZ